MVMTPPDRVGWQDERTRLLMADDDDMHCFDTMLMRATVFVEDACSGRSIEHRCVILTFVEMLKQMPYLCLFVIGRICPLLNFDDYIFLVQFKLHLCSLL